LRFSGRLSVTIASGPSRVIWMAVMAVFLLRAPF
jgi:hypothetical protein